MSVVRVPSELAALTPKPHRSKERVLFRARSRVRTGAVIADAAVDGAPFTPSELWGIVEGIPVEGGPLGAQRRVRAIRDGYDAMVRTVASGETPLLVGPTGVVVLPDRAITDHFSRAVELAARAIFEGIEPVEARLAANAELLANGIDVVALRADDLQRHSDAIQAIRNGGDTKPLFKLMLDRYNEND